MCHQSTLFKRCSTCGEEKLRSCFHTRADSPDGLRNECRDCRCAKSMAHHYANHEVRNARLRATWPARREAENAKRREFRAANRDKVRAQEYAYREAHPPTRSPQSQAQIESARVRARQWYADNTERAKANVARHKEQNEAMHRAWQVAYLARRKNAVGSFTGDEWAALCERYGNRCLACGADGPLTVDHVVPLSKGGTNDIANCQPLCKSCNCRKNASIVDYRPTEHKEQNDVAA